MRHTSHIQVYDVRAASGNIEKALSHVQSGGVCSLSVRSERSSFIRCLSDVKMFMLVHTRPFMTHGNITSHILRDVPCNAHMFARLVQVQKSLPTYFAHFYAVHAACLFMA